MSLEFSDGSERFFGVLHGSKVLSGFVKDSQGLSGLPRFPDIQIGSLTCAKVP